MPLTKDKPTRLLHVLGSLNTGGVETWLMHVLRHIDRARFQIDFCCLSGEEGVYAAEAKALGSQIFPIKLTSNLLAFNRQFSCLLHRGQYDIVHSHVHKFSGYIVRLAAKNGVRCRIAHSFTKPRAQPHSPMRLLYLKLMNRWINQYANMGLGNSKDSMQALFGLDWPAQARRKLLYCGIDLAPFAQTTMGTDIRAQLGIPADASVIGHVGRLTPAKNHKFILEIAEVIQKQQPRIWFLFVGSGPLQAELEEQIQQKQLTNIVFSGVVRNVAPFLQSMDLFLFPSLWEGLPQSVIEAQAVGLRCLCADTITTEVAVVSEAVQFMSLDHTATEWAQTSIELLSTPRLSACTAQQAIATSPFAIERSVQELAQIYATTSLP